MVPIKARPNRRQRPSPAPTDQDKHTPASPVVVEARALAAPVRPIKRATGSTGTADATECGSVQRSFGSRDAFFQKFIQHAVTAVTAAPRTDVTESKMPLPQPQPPPPHSPAQTTGAVKLDHRSDANLAACPSGDYDSSPDATSDGIKPDKKPQQTVWILMLCLQYVVTSLLMAWFYTRTYRYSARQFKENPALAEFFIRDKDGMKESPETLKLVRLRIERQILTKCLILSLTVMIFYAPFLSYQIQSYAVGAIPFFDLTGLYYTIGVIMIAADVSLTAILVIAFKKEVRDSFAFWKSF
ncbi:hypothetical protein HDU83_006944 [Entophlyctis luteolus]|nr:hypothetical protein HDU83_006944 [Entophlyctis luteolus]KAJ3379100.1 hypothetical protein HDU84_007048 [Entophlyctis sp. JEL0112]